MLGCWSSKRVQGIKGELGYNNNNWVYTITEDIENPANNLASLMLKILATVSNGGRARGSVFQQAAISLANATGVFGGMLGRTPDANDSVIFLGWRPGNGCSPENMYHRVIPTR